MKWKARDAWLCLLAWLILGFIISLFRFLARRDLTDLVPPGAREHFVEGTVRFVRATSWVLLAYWFSRGPAIRDFLVNSGLARRTSASGWWFALAAMGIALVHRYGASRGWTSGHTGIGWFRSGGEDIRQFAVIFVILLSPFCEEIFLRGFLYRAFRNSYGQLLSTAIVLGVAAWIHAGALIHSLWTAASLISLWILLCVVRERTASLWDCVLAHVAYTATLNLRWPLWVAPMALVVLLLLGTRDRTGAPDD